MQYRVIGRVLRGVDSLHYHCTSNDVVSRAPHPAEDDEVDSKLKTVEVRYIFTIILCT